MASIHPPPPLTSDPPVERGGPSGGYLRGQMTLMYMWCPCYRGDGAAKGETAPVCLTWGGAGSEVKVAFKQVQVELFNLSV